MRIVHIVAVGPFTKGMTYQENVLPQCQGRQGHQVTIIANCTYWNKGKVDYTVPEEVELGQNLKLVRLPFVPVLNPYFTEKLRLLKGLYAQLKVEKPQLIYLHDFETCAVYQLKKYLDENKETALVIDSHVSAVNSARSFVSRRVLHQMIYRHLGWKIYPYAKKIYYVGEDEKSFLQEAYGFPQDKLIFLPLGGMILPREEYESIRRETRDRYQIEDGKVCLIHSGKLDPSKRTLELLDAYLKRNDRGKSALYIVGDTEDKEHKQIILELVGRDESIHYLGWKSGEELVKLLCAADVYVQPGTPSATFQTAMCNRCGVIGRRYPSYEKYSLREDMLFSNDKALADWINRLCKDPNQVAALRKVSFDAALEKLDYNMQSEVIIKDAFEGEELDKNEETR